MKQWTKPAPDRQITGVATDLLRSKPELIAENAFLRQQVIVLKRQSTGRPSIMQHDRRVLVILASKLRGWQDALHLVKPDTVLVVDSSSTDETVPLALQEGYRVHRISRSEFNHGRTRQLAVEMLDNIDIVVMLTQDALLDKPDSLGNIVSSFENEKVGVAYGRQLPRRGAGSSEAHARLFNYPPDSRLKKLEDAPVLGVVEPCPDVHQHLAVRQDVDRATVQGECAGRRRGGT